MSKLSKPIQVHIEKFTYGGECLGRLPDGRAVFVPFTLPGEDVLLNLVEDKPRYARGQLVEILKPSDLRIEPRCKHYTQCGGCHYQHLSHKEQLEAKADILVDQLRRIGKILHPPILDTMTDEHDWGYRNKATFHVSPTGSLGFVSSGKKSVLPVEECHLFEKDIDELWRHIDLENNADVSKVSFRTNAIGAPMIELIGRTTNMAALEIDYPINIVHSTEQSSIVIAGDDHTTQMIQGKEFRVSAGVFFQVNTTMAGKMVTYIVENTPISSGKLLVDAYCGVGLFSAFLAPLFEDVIGIEMDARACEDFQYNLDEYNHISLYEASVEQALQTIERNIDVLLVDPPRAGLHKKVIDAINTNVPDTLIYVSCDPSTLARDANRLSKTGLELVSIQMLDMFPQTYHIETISVWKIPLT